MIIKVFVVQVKAIDTLVKQATMITMNFLFLSSLNGLLSDQSG